MLETAHARTGSWSFPATLRFGAGALADLSGCCRALGVARPLFVCGPTVSVGDGARAARDLLAKGGIAAHPFDGLCAPPTLDAVAAGLAAFREGACDGVVAMGGGAALDAGKAVALLAGQAEAPDDPDEPDTAARLRAAAAPPVPLIAIPTTAGTGTETGPHAVLRDTGHGGSLILERDDLVPRATLADPELTLSLPAHITAATGMDALTRCLEAYLSPHLHPFCDALAFEGVRLAHAWLARTVADGADLSARAGMQQVSALGGAASAKGFGAIRALARAVADRSGSHHGLTAGVLAPYVLAWARPATGAKLARLSACLGLSDTAADETGGQEAILDWLLELRRAFRVPDTLADLGVDPRHASRIVETVDTGMLATSPLPLGPDAIGEILDAAFTGRLG